MKSLTEKLNFSAHFGDAAAGEDRSRPGRLIYFLLCAILVFALVAFGAVDAWALGLLSIVAGALAVFWLADAWLKKEFRFSPSALQLPLAGLILIGLVQLLPLGGDAAAAATTAPLQIAATRSLSLDPYATRLFVVQLTVYSVFFAAVLAHVDSHQRWRSLVLLTIVCGALAAFFGILQRLAGGAAIYGVRPTPQAIPFGPFVNQHHFAAFMNMTLGLALGLLFGRAAQKEYRLLLASAAFVMAVALVMTGSRGGMISFFGVLSFFLLPKLLPHSAAGAEAAEGAGGEAPPRKIVLAAGAAAAAIALIGTIIFLGGDESLFRAAGLQPGQGDLTSGRAHFWGVALQIFLDHPVLGAGLDAFGAAFTRYDTWNGTFRVEQAHNDYLQMLADAGVLGLACAAAFVYFLVKNSLPNLAAAPGSFRRAAATGALAGCFGILIHSFFDFPLRTPSNAFFFLTLAALATTGALHEKRRVKIRKKKSRKGEKSNMREAFCVSLGV